MKHGVEGSNMKVLRTDQSVNCMWFEIGCFLLYITKFIGFFYLKIKIKT